MRTASAIAALAALPAVLGISLSDFTPRPASLPSACSAIYTMQVPGCLSSDFTSGKGCSDSCISALRSLVQPLQIACSGAAISGTVLDTFVTGDGVKSLCPNAAAAPAQAPVSTQPATSAAPVQQPTTTQQAATTTSPSSTSTPPSSSSTSVVVEMTSSSSLSPVSTSSVLSSSSGSSSSSASSSAQSSSATHDSTSSNSAVSTTTSISNTRPTTAAGGGSPFDITSGSSALVPTSALALVLSALLTAYIA